jgi:hypothetical protein
MQTDSSTEQQMQPDAANPVEVAAAATLPFSGVEQQLGELPDETECIQSGSTSSGTALQLMHRAASMPLPEAESPRSDAAGEYCMRLVSKHCFILHSLIVAVALHLALRVLQACLLAAAVSSRAAIAGICRTGRDCRQGDGKQRHS